MTVACVPALLKIFLQIKIQFFLTKKLNFLFFLLGLSILLGVEWG
jgi:hypothetical protein